MSTPETGEVPRGGRVESASKLNGGWLPPQQHQLSSLSNSPAPSSSIHAVNLPQMSTFVSSNHNNSTNRHNQAAGCSSRGVISKINVASPEVAHDNNKSKVIELARLISGAQFFLFSSRDITAIVGVSCTTVSSPSVLQFRVCCSGIRT